MEKQTGQFCGHLMKQMTVFSQNDVSDKQSAVKMKLFGKLTRDTFEWHPDKLLCKRFNVPDPYPR